MPWEITLFGSLSLRDPSSALPAVTRFRTQKAAALLAYLALHGVGRLCTRERVTEALWPDADPVAGRNRFKQELATLRRHIEPLPLSAGDIVEVSGRTHVGIRANAVTTDVMQFEHLVATAGLPDTKPERAFHLLQEAADLHGSSGLLPHLYEEWLASERERLRLLYLSVLHRLIRLHTQSIIGEYSVALAAAHNLISADPSDEQAYVALVQLLIAHGQLSQARQQWDRWEKIAREELGAPVDPAVEKLISDAERQQLALVLPSSVPAAVPPPLSSSPSAAEPAIPPPLAAPLPLARSRFFGRDDKIADVLRLLRDEPMARVITLTGAGGAGKTRLAQEIARALPTSLAGEASVIFRGFVPLADITDPTALTNAIFTALFPSAQQTAEERLRHLVETLQQEYTAQYPAETTASPRQLLILDNMEQIGDDGGVSVLYELTERLPHLVCLVTSRRSLDMEGEHVIALAPLPLPSAAITRPEDALKIPSVALWVDRARVAAPDFRLSAQNVGDIAALCHLLDGLPLALEIAAARIGSLSPTQMRRTLEDGHGDTLVSRRRDVPARHRSVHDTASWSYDLLPRPLQELWARLSVFRGGWTLDAAAAVADASPTAVLEKLDALRHHSLIVADASSSGEEKRFYMLESLRTFAEEVLGENDARKARQQHLAYFLALTEQADRELRGDREWYWMHRLEAEKPNLRAALRFSLRHAEESTSLVFEDPLSDAPLRLCDALAQFWWMRGYIPEGRVWLRRALQAVPVAPPRIARTEALRAAAALALNQDDNTEAHGLASEALSVAMQIDNKRGIGYAHHTLGRIALNRGDYTMARRHLEEAIAIMESYGPQKPLLIANAQAIQRQNLGIALQNLGLLDEAVAVYEKAMAHWRGQGMVHRYNVAGLLVLQSEASLLQGDLDSARLLATEGLAKQRESGVRGDLDHALRQMGRVEAWGGNRDAALAAYCESLDVARASGNRRGIVEGIEAISNLLLDCPFESQQEDGARLRGWTQMMRRQFSLPMSPTKQSFWGDAETHLATAFDETRHKTLLLEGSLLSEEDAVSLARSAFV